jgi:hypothetical protein
VFNDGKNIKLLANIKFVQEVCDKDGKLIIPGVQYVYLIICSLNRHLEENGPAEVVYKCATYNMNIFCCLKCD